MFKYIYITMSKLAISGLKSFISQCFHLRDLSKMRNFLVIEVFKSKQGIYLSQHKYVIYYNNIEQNETVQKIFKTSSNSSKKESVTLNVLENLIVSRAWWKAGSWAGPTKRPTTGIWEFMNHARLENEVGG